MSKPYSDHLIDLITSLTKAEKRKFKLQAKRNSGQDDLKYILLFDYIDKSVNYSDAEALKKIPSIKREQLSNIKAHLYKQILSCLRSLKMTKSTQIEIRELIDYAVVLIDKGFYQQALKQLERAGQLAKKGGYNILALDVVELEKHIESQFFSKTLGIRADYLSNQSASKEKQVSYSVFFSNLNIQLHSLYLKVGFARDEKETLFVRQFFQSKMIDFKIGDLGLESKINYYSAMVNYNHMIQDFVMCYKYSRQWVDMFFDHPEAIESRTENFLQAQHNLLIALFHLRDYRRFTEVLESFENQYEHIRGKENIEHLYFLYLHTDRINKYYFEGNYELAIELVPEITDFIEKYESKLDEHQIVVLHYKIACLYFGNDENKMAIRYLNKVIQFKDSSIREDIQCFARILNLIAHFQLGNDELVEYQVKSVYRFLIKMGELHGVQKEIFFFLRQLPFANMSELRKGFRILHRKLVKLAQDPYEKRAFLYLDIISWLECKLDNRPINEVVREKFMQEIKTGNKLYFPKAQE